MPVRNCMIIWAIYVSVSVIRIINPSYLPSKIIIHFYLLYIPKFVIFRQIPCSWCYLIRKLFIIKLIW